MPEVLAGIDLVVSRAGATTLAELTSLGIPSILIPSPYVTNNHQEKNARSLSDYGAAHLLLEKDLNNKSLISHIDRILLNHDQLKEMKTKAKKMGVPDSAHRLYAVMKQLVKPIQK
jgi:UDP-N-acetylglucosamine--N-acetylmuramyl-(pentapeptide) pyrophosphoryl-undecaprenol N-acetylglucosamine transferase